MKQFLGSIRKPEKKKGSFLPSIMILVLGIVLGIFSKWLDNLALDSGIWWHGIIEAADLNNVFSEFPVWLLFGLAIAVYSRRPLRAAVNTFLFFAGMCASYHLYTLMFAGFDPGAYMRIWYAITAVSPLLAAVCWYGKGKHPVSIIIDICIMAVFAVCCFSIGWLYFYTNGIINMIIYFLALLVLYESPLQTVITAAGSVIMGIMLRFFY